MKAKIITGDGIKEIGLNRRRAIKFICLDCSGFQRNEVRDCQLKDCPLYSFRTGEGKQDPVKRKGSIRAYCTDCMAGQLYEIKNCISSNCPLFNFRVTRQREFMANFLKKDHLEHISEKIISG